MAKSTLSNKHVIIKHNDLNSLRPNDMTLQELRFFTVYLSRVNPLDESTRVVRFSLKEFQGLMGLRSRFKTSDVEKTVNTLLSRVIIMPLHAGGFTAFQLFKKFTISTSALDGVIDMLADMNWLYEGKTINMSTGEYRLIRNADGDIIDGESISYNVTYTKNHKNWYVEINASDDALPFLFNLKRHYFKYQLWNTLRLKSVNQLRMYEILKQYERIGSRIIYVAELRHLLGIDSDKYKRFNKFRVDVIDVCQKALAEYTDISFTYEPYGERGPGGKIDQLKFTITKNTTFASPLNIDKAIVEASSLTQLDLNDISHEEAGGLVTGGVITQELARMIFFRGAFDHRFTVEDIQVLYNSMLHNLPETMRADDKQIYGHMKYWFDELQLAESKGIVQKSSFGYLKKLIAKPIPGTNINPEIAAAPKNRFNNFKGRNNDYANIEKLERALLDERLVADAILDG